MLTSFYDQILFMSAAGSAVYLVYTLSSDLLRSKMSGSFAASWQYYSSLIIYSFFVIPYFMLESLLSVVREPAYFPDFSVLNIVTELTDNEEIRVRALNYAGLFYEFLPFILILGTLIYIIAAFVKSFSLKLRILSSCRIAAKEEILTMIYKCRQEMGIRREFPVYISSFVCTPFIFGCIKPRIVLPDIEFTPEELRYIFLHELTHWKAGDAWVKCYVLLVNALHWFNPIVYLACRKIVRYCELSCDERVVARMDYQERRRYCELILSILWSVAGHKTNTLFAFNNDRGHLEKRIKMILEKENFKSKKGMIAIASILTLLFAATGALASSALNPVANERAVREKNIVEERIGNSTPSDESKYIFLDSYFETNDDSAKSEVENVAEEGIGGSTSADESKHVFLDSYFESNTAVYDKNDIGILTQYNIDWDIAGGEDTHGVSRLSMSQGAKIRYSISWSPQPGVIQIGLYNHNTGRYFWPASSAASPLGGTITVPETGLYSFAVRNTTDTAIRVTGHFRY